MLKEITRAVIFLSAVWSAAAVGTVASKILKRGTAKRSDGTAEDIYVFGKNKGGFAAVSNTTPFKAAKAVTKKHFKK